MTCFIDLPNFPEWAIPMTKIIPKTYTEDAYMGGAITWTVYCRHLWQITPNSYNSSNQVTLRIDIESSATTVISGQTQSIPVYIDIDLVFFNQRTGNQINSNKV